MMAMATIAFCLHFPHEIGDRMEETPFCNTFLNLFRCKLRNKSDCLQVSKSINPSRKEFAP
jgi:hypothetical protein